MSWVFRDDISGWTTRTWCEESGRGTLDMRLRNETLATAMLTRAAGRPNEIAIWLDDGSTITFADAATEARVLAAALHGLGLKPGDRVSAQLPNWREFVILNLACSTLGLVINPIISIYRGAEVSFIIQDAGSRVLFIPEIYRNHDYLKMASAVQVQLPQLEHLVVVRPQMTQVELAGSGVIAYHHLLERGRHVKVPVYQADPDAIKLLMYTSGTTGNAKGVLHSHNSFSRVLDNMLGFRNYGRGDVLFMASPVTHITGYLAVELPFLSEAKSALMEQWDKAKAVDFIQKTQASFSVGATPFLHELIQECTSRGIGLDSMKQFICGGAAVPPDLIRLAHKVFTNCRCSRVYGSTETPLVSQGITDKALEMFASETDGPVFNYDVKTIDASGNSLPTGEEGEIIVRGPAMTLGYTNAIMTEHAFNADGYFLTGDLGQVDASGNILVTGRKKDLIIRGGENISAKEIEDVLHKHPMIQEAAVVSMPHSRLGEGIAAYVRLVNPDEILDHAQLAAFVNAAGLARQKTPERLEIVEDFPRTASGKIRKDLLREDIKVRLKVETEEK